MGSLFSLFERKLFLNVGDLSVWRPSSPHGGSCFPYEGPLMSFYPPPLAIISAGVMITDLCCCLILLQHLPLEESMWQPQDAGHGTINLPRIASDALQMPGGDVVPLALAIFDVIPPDEVNPLIQHGSSERPGELQAVQLDVGPLSGPGAVPFQLRIGTFSPIQVHQVNVSFQAKHLRTEFDFQGRLEVVPFVAGGVVGAEVFDVDAAVVDACCHVDLIAMVTRRYVCELRAHWSNETPLIVADGVNL